MQVTNGERLAGGNGSPPKPKQLRLSMQSKREQRKRYLDLLQGECEKQNAILSAVQEFMPIVPG